MSNFYAKLSYKRKQAAKHKYSIESDKSNENFYQNAIYFSTHL